MKTLIIIPAYNAGKYLSKTIESVRSQTLANWNLVVIDDGSTDDTASIAQRYSEFDPRIRVVRQDKHGSSAARNRGIEEITCDVEYVAFLDADDLWQPDTLEILIEVLLKFPDAVAAYGQARFIDENGELLYPGIGEALATKRQGVIGREIVAWQHEQPTTFSVLVYINCIWTPGQVLIRRASLKSTGLFDCTIAPVADWDMWIRLALWGDIAFLDKLVLDYRRHNSNMSSKDDVMRQAELSMRRRLIFSDEMSLEQCRTALYGYRYSERYFSALRLGLAKKCLREGQILLAVKNFGHAIIRYTRSHFGLLRDKK